MKHVNIFALVGLILFFSITYSFANIHNENRLNLIMENDKNSPINTNYVIGEFFCGVFGGVCTGYLGALVGSVWGNSVPGITSGVVTGTLLAFPIGSSVGIYLYGNAFNESGSFGATFLGGYLGEVIIFLPTVIFTDNTPASYLPSFIGAAIGGTIGYNSSRRKITSTTNETGLINIEDGRVNLSFPSVHLQNISSEKNYVKHQINLLNISF